MLASFARRFSLACEDSYASSLAKLAHIHHNVMQVIFKYQESLFYLFTLLFFPLR